MKKILTIALVALLAAGTAFAGLSGYSNLGFGYNSQSGSFGFSPSSALSVDIDVATADGSNVGEGDIYAGIDGSITLRLVDAATANNQYGTLYMYNAGNDSGYYSLGIFASINSAYIAGNDWKVSFGTASSNPVDFAKSAVDTYTAQLKDVYNYAYWTKSSAISYKAPYASTNGFVAEYKDYKVGIGFVGTKSDETTVGFTAYALTPEIELGDSAKVKVGAVASKSNEAGKYVSAGASLQGTFAVDEFSAKASADFGLENIGAEKDGNKFHFDAAANFKYDFASLDVYYADFISVQGYHLEAWAPVKDAAKTEYKNLLSVKAAFDLNSFDVPVAITLKGKDLINKQNLSASVDVAVSEAVTVTVGGGYGIKSEKVTVNAGVEYKDEKFTASAKVDFSLKGEDKQLYPTVVVSSDAIVNGATLELSWKPATDGSGSTTTNLLNKDADFGKIYATAKLAF
jgi:hypothetical protein